MMLRSNNGPKLRHSGFTEEELDFIINFDIKYRMGISGQADEDE